LKTVYISSGLIAPKRQGNQSIKNTIIGYLEAGWNVRHFSMISEKNPDYDFGDLKAFPGYRHFGFPNWILSSVKGKSRKASPDSSSDLDFVPPDQVVDLGNTEITPRQILLARAYAVVERIRFFLHSIRRRPDLYYGYEIYGAKAAYDTAQLFHRPVFTRFQGTYVTDANWEFGPIQYHKDMMALPVDGVIMANDGTKGDVILARLGVPDNRVFFQPNGLDPQMLEKQPVNHEDDGYDELYRRMNPENRRYLAGIFNRYYPFKRIDRALILIRRLVDQGMDIQLAIASGGGPLEEKLRSLANNLDIDSHVSWLGRVPFEQMSRVYNSCDVVFLLNDYANSGNQLYEAITTPKPLVATDDDNNSRLFHDCPYALFFKPDHFFDINADTIEKLIRTENLEYRSDFLVSWERRMEREINWIEKRVFG
jgi:glycosyltransferase involved in cell wall biosynthesis